jgi:hypothetical protein
LKRIELLLLLLWGVGARDGGFELGVGPLEGFKREEEEEGGAAMVVVRELAVEGVSSIVEGGGGRGDRTEARQRKHSPVPKYLGAGCG